MNRTLSGNIAFFSGFMINIALLLYVYFAVEGGSAALKQGGDWVAILNEIPETVVTIIVAVVLPYLMIWTKFKDHRNKLSSASKTMLTTTLISGTVILFSHQTLTKELSIDIGWVILWFTAFYFLMVPNIEHSDQP